MPVSVSGLMAYPHRQVDGLNAASLLRSSKARRPILSAGSVLDSARRRLRTANSRLSGPAYIRYNVYMYLS